MNTYGDILFRYCEIYDILMNTYGDIYLRIVLHVLTYRDIYVHLLNTPYVWWSHFKYSAIYLRMVQSTDIFLYLLTYGAYTTDTMDSALVKGTGRLPAKHVTGKISLPSTKVQECLLK